MIWPLQEAKKELNRVIQQARISGPQTITVQGKEAAVVLSAEDYRRLTEKKNSLVSFFQSSPWAEVEIDLTRSRETGRDIEL